jgi:hypothetical protein
MNNNIKVNYYEPRPLFMLYKVNYDEPRPLQEKRMATLFQWGFFFFFFFFFFAQAK